MEAWIQQILMFLPAGGKYHFLIFFVAFAESLPVAGLLIPGSTIIVLAGFLVVAGKGNLATLILLAVLGALCGDLLSLWLGKSYGGIFLRMRFFRRRRTMIRYAQKFFLTHGGKSLFFARFLGPIRGIVPFIAGLSQMPGRGATGYILISSILWGICYPGLGYLGGSSLQQAQTMGARFGLAVFLLLLVVLVHYQVKKLFR
ncbi:DedA family protein [Pelovirga terrestris]|uniref:DedA family protein n=1 Tax=Pelovirga terrestris TaxID=2771352 RepID=A0A8J6QSH7_9BACT|nr:DedA family protein [Pelovirga terrestris]MBD1401678.1 DedA family protein [Pelovirga terrestris]